MREKLHDFLKSDYLKLLPILALAFYLAFIPHQSYPYPVHIDEWIHLAYSKALMRAGSVIFAEPFSLHSPAGLSPNLEAGFHLFWGVFQRLSDVSWMDIFRYFPGVIFMMTVLSAYVLGKREGFGWEAALFTSLVPTTVGILGPAFLVPVALGLLFILLSVFVAFNFKTVWSYVALFISMCFLLSIHAATAVGLVIVLGPFILLNLKGNSRHSLGMVLALGLPFFAVFPWIFDMLAPTFKSLFSTLTLPTYIQWPQVIQAYGYLPTSFCALGVFLLARKGDKRNYGMVFGLLALLLMLVIYIRLHHGVGIMYDRGLMYAMLMMGIIAGYGLMGVRRLKLPKLNPLFLAQNIGNILCLVLIGVTLAMCIPARHHIPYYHMIDAQDYEAFVWVEENVNEGYDKAILDPWKATAFTAISEKSIYTRIHAYPKSSDMRAYQFLRSGCRDTEFLKKNGISIVYTRWGCSNPDLVRVRENVYLLGMD